MLGGLTYPCQGSRGWSVPAAKHPVRAGCSGPVFTLLQQCKHWKKFNTPRGEQKYRAQSWDRGCRVQSWDSMLGSSHHVTDTAPQIARWGERFASTALFLEIGTSHGTWYLCRGHICTKFMWEEGRVWPCLSPLVQPQMGESNLNSNMTSSGTLSDRIPSAGTPSEPQHGREPLWLSMDGARLRIPIFLLALGGADAHRHDFLKILQEPMHQLCCMKVLMSEPWKGS